MNVMSVPRRSTVRVPSLDDPTGSQNGVVVEIPSAKCSNTFSISYADQRPGSSRVSSSGTAPLRPFFDASEGEGDIPTSEEGESELEGEDRARMAAPPTLMTGKARAVAADGSSSTELHQFEQTPHFSRTMSMPLPTQLSHLQHPHRQPTRTIYSSPITPIQPASPFNSLSVELADSFQMVIQTMLQISPPQVLESAKEQYSACSLSIPTPSMSAMFTAMKTLNYMSANLLRFYSSESQTLGYSDGEAKVQNVFDIGELLQGVGDTLSGVAAQASVDLVLHHGEVGVRHVYVKGDECGIAYALLHIVRQVLDKAQPGDLVELGLGVTTHGVQSGTPSIPEEVIEGRVTASPIDMDSLRCSIKIEHKYGPSQANESQVEANGETSDDKSRTNPDFTTLLLRRLLRLIDAQFTIQNNVEDGQTYEVSLLLDKAASPVSKPPGALSGSAVLEEPSGLDTDPSVEQLLAFGETLKGRKVTLYASSPNAFTRHITNYLAAWDMDVSYVYSDNSGETSIGEGTPTPVSESRYSTPTGVPTAPTPEATASISASKPSGPENQPPMSFVLIDDDVGILRERLQARRLEQQPLNLNPRARPSLAALHRPKSSPQIARVLGQSAPSHPSPPVVILHFTSLANFKATKDVIQSIMSSYGSTLPPPEVMIIPKPVGPRRFFTAMHTAVTRPTIDPFFLPTATSPGTPGVHHPGSFFPPAADPETNNQTPQTGSPFARANRPLSSRTNSDRSTKEHLLNALPSPSPLSIPDNSEYFPDPAGKKLGSSPSSGYLVSSPDGQPAGIFFHPRSKKNASPQSAERFGNQMAIPRRSSIPRLVPGGERESMSFSTLHEVSTQTPRSATELRPPATPSPKGNTPISTPVVPVTRDAPSTPGPRSPPESPGNEIGPSQKAAGKKPAQEKQNSIGKATTPAAGKKGKASTSTDGNIVPPISVLIVDDNPINQTILSTFMKRKKIQFGIANNGKEAVEKWKTGGFHLILMDIQMPIMDGIEATREIRRLEKLNGNSEFLPATPSQLVMDAPTPSTTASEARSATASSPYRSSVIIVALTASSLQTDRVNALAAGCNDFLTKPVSLLWLNNKIIEWGSIKALQMWADIRPEAVTKMSKGQIAQARAVAERLHVPPKKSKSPQGRTSISEKGSPPPELAAVAAAEAPTKTLNQDVADEASMNTLESGGESGSATPSSSPKRRRSQKRDSLPESLRLKVVGIVEEAHVTSSTSSLTNGGPLPPTGQNQDDASNVAPKAEKAERGQDNVSIQESQSESQPLNVTPPSQAPILRSR